MRFGMTFTYHTYLETRLDEVMNRPRLERDLKPKVPVSLYDDQNEGKSGEDMLTELKEQAAEERKKRLKEEEEEAEEEDEEERSYESDEKSDKNGEFDDESVVVKSQISDPGSGVLYNQLPFEGTNSFDEAEIPQILLATIVLCWY